MNILFLYLYLTKYLSVMYFLYQYIIGDRKPIFLLLLLLHLLLPLTPFKNEELLYLSGQTIWHWATTENGISVAHQIPSLSLSLSAPLILVNRNRRFVVTTTLDNEIEPVAVNGLIAGIIIILVTSLGETGRETN